MYRRGGFRVGVSIAAMLKSISSNLIVSILKWEPLFYRDLPLSWCRSARFPRFSIMCRRAGVNSRKIARLSVEEVGSFLPTTVYTLEENAMRECIKRERPEGAHLKLF